MSEWKDKLLLEDGHHLITTGSSSKGFMAETDVETYDIFGSDGEKVGSVTFTDHTAVRGFKRSLSVEQRNLAGEVIVKEAWTG